MLNRLPMFAALTAAAVTLSPTFAAPAQPGRTPHLSSPDQVPQGLKASDWSSIRDAYEHSRRAALPMDGGQEVCNPGQQWQTRFDGRGCITRPDAGGRILPAHFEPAAFGETSVRFTVEERGARSPLTIGPIAKQAYLKASNAGANDQFGVGLAVSGDTVVIGAPMESSDAFGVNGDDTNNRAPSSGAAYVFVRNGTTWTQQAYLKASNTNAYDFFGVSVAIDGDTVVVGAVSEGSNAIGVNGNQSDNSAPGAGAAYVFVRDGTTWTQQAYLKASNSRAGYGFGNSVTLSGNTAVIGSIHEASNATGINGNQGDHSAADAGAAYVFVRNGTTWTQQAYLKASNTETNDRFGGAVAVSRDTVIVGAYGEASAATGVNGNQNDNSAFHAGAAYVFVRNGTTWTQQAYLKASNTEAGDHFSDVGVSGDTAVVGAYNEASKAMGVNGDQSDNSAPNAGATYVFVRTGMTWTQEAYLKAFNTDAGDGFGRSVVSGDIVAVGAYLEDSNASGVNGDESDNSAPDAGAVYVFTGLGSGAGTPTPSATSTDTPPPSSTPIPTSAQTATNTPTQTAPPTNTSTQTPAATPSPTVTFTPAITGSPTQTPTPTITLTPGGCVGDCSDDKRVTVDELVKGVNIALGTASFGECPQFDSNGDHKVTVDELVKAVNNALNGCPRG